MTIEVAAYAGAHAARDEPPWVFFASFFTIILRCCAREDRGIMIPRDKIEAMMTYTPLLRACRLTLPTYEEIYMPPRRRTSRSEFMMRIIRATPAAAGRILRILANALRRCSSFSNTAALRHTFLPCAYTSSPRKCATILPESGFSFLSAMPHAHYTRNRPERTAAQHRARATSFANAHKPSRQCS